VSRVIFMCGPSGSGKSTYARRFEEDGMVRLSFDAEMWRRMREEYRALLEPAGVVPETVYLATDRATVLERVRARRGSHPDDFVLTDGLAVEHFDHFEPPSADEGPLEVIR